MLLVTFVAAAYWVIAIIECINGANAIEAGAGRLVSYSAANGLLIGLAIIILRERGKVGFWGWVAGVAWPLVTSTTSTSLYFDCRAETEHSVEKLDSIDDEDASSDENASSYASSDGDHFLDEDGTTDENEFTGDHNSIGEQESKGWQMKIGATQTN